MIKKIRRSNKRKSFVMSRKFAALLIGLFAGVAMGEFGYMCLLGVKMSVIFGAGFGYMIYNFYLGVMQDLEEERRRRTTYRAVRYQERKRENGKVSSYYSDVRRA